MKRIKVNINKTEREYDVYALLTSFFPGVEVVTAAGEEGEFEGVFGIDENDDKVTISLSFEDISSKEDFTIKAADKDAAKKEFGRYLYDFLSECTGRELPWGNLTGIRPTKLIRNMLEVELASKNVTSDSEIKETQADNSTDILKIAIFCIAFYSIEIITIRN